MKKYLLKTTQAKCKHTAIQLEGTTYTLIKDIPSIDCKNKETMSLLCDTVIASHIYDYRLQWKLINGIKTVVLYTGYKSFGLSPKYYPVVNLITGDLDSTTSNRYTDLEDLRTCNITTCNYGEPDEANRYLDLEGTAFLEGPVPQWVFEDLVGSHGMLEPLESAGKGFDPVKDQTESSEYLWNLLLEKLLPSDRDRVDAWFSHFLTMPIANGVYSDHSKIPSFFNEIVRHVGLPLDHVFKVPGRAEPKSAYDKIKCDFLERYKGPLTNFEEISMGGDFIDYLDRRDIRLVMDLREEGYDI